MIKKIVMTLMVAVFGLTVGYKIGVEIREELDARADTEEARFVNYARG